MEVRVLETFIGPSIYGLRPGILIAYTPTEKSQIEISTLGGDFPKNLAGLLERLQLSEESRKEIARASRLDGLLATLAIHLQRHAGAPVTEALMIQQDPGARCILYCECEAPNVGSEAAKLAACIIEHLLSGTDFDPERAMKELYSSAADHGIGGDQRYLLEAARERGIPAVNLRNHWIQLGHGRFRRQLWRAITDATPWSAVHRSTDKVLTNRILRELGLPAPAQSVARTAEQALEAARKIGFPVVTKPRGEDRQIGVTVDINDEAKLVKGFERANEYGSDVLVEEMLQGENYRALIIDGVIVSAIERHRAHVTGDGRQTVAELVEQANIDPRRGRGGNTPLVPLEIDDAALSLLTEQGLTPESVPAPEAVVIIGNFPYARVSDLTRDVTETLHPELRDAMVLGANALGLDIAGVDYITPDITRAPAEVGGGFCEINCTPMLQPHFATRPRDIAGPILEMLFPGGHPPHVPIVAICSDDGGDRIVKLLNRALTGAGHVVARATHDGLWAGEKCLIQGDATAPRAARTILQDPRIDAAIFETTVEQTIRRGLGFDACDVAILGAPAIGNTDKILAATVRAQECLVRIADRSIVIPVDHPLRAKLMEGREAEKFILVSVCGATEATDAHVAGDGTVLLLDRTGDSPTFTYIEATKPPVRIPLPDLAETADDREISAAALAIAAALALGLKAEVMFGSQN